MEKNMMIPLEIYYLNNFLEAELVDIQEVEIKDFDIKFNSLDFS